MRLGQDWRGRFSQYRLLLLDGYHLDHFRVGHPADQETFHHSLSFLFLLLYDEYGGLRDLQHETSQSLRVQLGAWTFTSRQTHGHKTGIGWEPQVLGALLTYSKYP